MGFVVRSLVRPKLRLPGYGEATSQIILQIATTTNENNSLSWMHHFKHLVLHSLFFSYHSVALSSSIPLYTYALTMTRQNAVRQIDNILALFEANTTASTATHSSLRSNARTKDLSPSKRLRGNLKERIQAFERVNESTRTMGSCCSARDLEGLKFEDLPTRKSSLLESFASTDRTMSSRLLVSQELAMISRTPIRHRRQLQRRASTGRVRFGEIHALWECRNAYATQLRSNQQQQQSRRHDDNDDRRADLQRRHSTGCLGALNNQPDSTSEFWQVYEQDDNAAPQKPMKKRFTRRRTVRFAQHVTVFVFAKETNATDQWLNLPQEFIRKTAEGEEDPMTKERKKKMSEGRFASNNKQERNNQAPPSMPLRKKHSVRSNIGTAAPAVDQAPETPSRKHRPADFPEPARTTSQESQTPPKQPQRQLTQRRVTDAPKQPQRKGTVHDNSNSPTLRHSSTAMPKKPQRQATKRNLKSGSPKKPQRQETKRNLTDSPKKPQRQLTERNLDTKKDNRSPIKPQRRQSLHGSDISALQIRDLTASPKKPERQPTVHKSALSPIKPQRQPSDHGGELDVALMRSFHESRGSKASKNTLMYDSFGKCSETSESSDSDIESIDSDLFSVEEKYVITIAKPKVPQDSEEVRRGRVLMWFRRMAMPSYHMMKHHVRTTPGLGITLDDVDLLPWSTNNATYRIK